MKTKHTPGPWFACCTERTPHFVFSESSEKTICGIYNNDPEDSKYESLEQVLTIEEARANSKLIASAPDLLEALMEVVRISDRNHIAWDKAKQAIKKATE